MDTSIGAVRAVWSYVHTYTYTYTYICTVAHAASSVESDSSSADPSRGCWAADAAADAPVVLVMVAGAMGDSIAPVDGCVYVLVYMAL